MASEDLLSKAAKALEEMDAPPVTEESPVVDLPVLEELPTLGDDEEVPDEWPIEEVLAEKLPEFTETSETEVEEVEVETETEEGEEQPESPLTMIDELPKVITADMLRARKDKALDINLDDIEIPAELLVGLEDDEQPDEDWLKEEIESRDKGKSKSKSRGKKGARADTKARARRRRAQTEDNEDYDEYL